VLYVETGSRKEKKRRKERRKGKGRKRKEEKKKKIMINFLNLTIFREKNKRQFMKLVKIIFIQERNSPNYN
jgi:hypothetical protein